MSSSTDISQTQPQKSCAAESNYDTEHEAKGPSILPHSDESEFDSDLPYDPSFLSSTDSDITFECSSDEDNNETNERASPVIPYIED